MSPEMDALFAQAAAIAAYYRSSIGQEAAPLSYAATPSAAAEGTVAAPWAVSDHNFAGA